MTRQSLFLMAGTLLLGSLVAAPSQATLLLYEGFDYTSGANALVGQTGGIGWDGTAWAEGGTANGLQNAGVVDASNLVFSDFATTGNVGQVQNNNNSGDNYNTWIGNRQLPNTFSIAAGSTAYVSFLFRQEQAASFALDAFLRLSDDPTGGTVKVVDQVNVRFGDNNPDNVGFGYGTPPVGANGIYPQQTPVLVINKLENLGGAGTQNGAMWILSEANFDAIKAGGVTESELDANNLVKITDDATGISLDGGDYLQLWTRTAFGIQNNAYYDEFKIFTDLNDLQSVPEPASLALLGLGGLLMLSRRRKA